MTIVPYKPTPQKRTGTKQPRRGFVRRLSDSITLTRMGYLYLVAAAFQGAWIYFIVSHWDVASEYMSIPMFGWLYKIVWPAMVVCSLFLIYIGSRLIYLSRKEGVRLSQSSEEKRRSDSLALLLFLGIMMDVLLGWVFLTGHVSTSNFVGLSALAGARILQANMEAVFQYYQ